MQAGNAVGVAVVGLVFYATLGPTDTPGRYTSASLAGTGPLLVFALTVVVLTPRLATPHSNEEEHS